MVKVGLFVENISNLDLQEGSFQADFYLWFVWKGDIDPTKTYELTNALPLQLAAVAGSTTKDGTPVPDVQPDGNHQVFHVKGRFTSEFKTGNYPLDDANLVISVEDVKYDSSVLVYEFDNGSGMSANTKVTAREVRAPTARVTEHFYATTFGYEGEPGDVAFSRLDITMKAERPGVALVLQSIFPLVVVVFAAMASLLIESPAGEEGGDAHWWWLATRLSLAVPAVIAAVALQFTASTGVPREGQVLLIDRIYLLSYAVILAVIAITVVTHRALRKGRPQRTKKVDRWSLFSLVPMFLGGIALILLLR
ncbi:MAG: hypothetical protein QOI99_786 [Actinomycetota bacterium]|nr:hypothetical protein [Actinomycetota bacterium]